MVRRFWLAPLLAADLAFAGALASADLPGGRPPPGNERALLVPQIEMLEAAGLDAPTIDGRLDEPAWRRATTSGGFWNSLQDHRPSDQTEVLVISDRHYLYVGFRLFDAQPDAIQGTRTVRDGGLGFDDSITVELDTFFNRRDISTFSLNPLGTQSDVIAGGRSSKIEWKGDWLGAAARTDDGWSAEFAIPLAMLNYDRRATTFGANFRRYQSRTREHSLWADITPQSLPERMGRLDGLVLPSAAATRAWSVMPYALAGRNVRNERGTVDRSHYTAGIDVRYQPRPDLTAMFSANPDFTSIEDVFADISFSYTEKALADNRPFFAEGAGYFSSDDQFFYSNRIPDLDYGAKTFGRWRSSQFGILATQSADDRSDFVGRSRLELGETSSATATLVGTRRPDFDNLLAVAQLQGRQRSGFTYWVDAALTRTDDATPLAPTDGDGRHLRGSLGWQWNHAWVWVSEDRYDPEYLPANARLDSDLRGTRGTSVETGYYRESSGSFWRVVQGYANHTRRKTEADRLQREKVSAGVSVELTNDVRVALDFDEGPYRPAAGAPGAFEEMLNDDRYASVAMDFNTRSNRGAGGFAYAVGDLAGASYEYMVAHGWWRPSNAVALNLAVERVDSFGVSHQVTVGSSWDVTPEHSLSGRYIYSEEDDFYRLAYTHRPRRGLDVLIVYDGSSARADEVFLKIVRAF
jgi:hypothetical protein